ncbi:MAG: 1-acyl-sn-glycerol-3-phosphate acyltransferase [Lachnospiraceae bacterium]|nr:1-acyl-sn-glycerol-3-phosphate acyltransferase [Lachnospiraceae bacterium]
MKIKTRKMPYEKVMEISPAEIKDPLTPSPFLRKIMNLVSASELKQTGFECNVGDMKDVTEGEPVLYLMNHSSFTDLKIATCIIKEPYNIICTTDALVGKEKLMRSIGCIPTQKFTADIRLVNDISYALNTLKTSVLMYPEAGYTFDGTTTTLPESIGKLVKVLGFPVVMICSHGAFLRDPLYNGLRLRKCKVTADKYTLFTRDEIRELSIDQINERIGEAFSFDNLKEQFEKGIRITESSRAEGLSRVLYKCPVCGSESHMSASGISLSCRDCGSVWELSELGKMEYKNPSLPEMISAPVLFDHIPDWYRWERECVRKELEDGTYHLEIPVRIMMIVDYKAMYEVGEGVLTHSDKGFHLTGCGGKLDYYRKPLASYTVNADYFFYEIGDMVSFGDKNKLFYCFPKEDVDIVAKTRLAAEELYKIAKNHA